MSYVLYRYKILRIGTCYLIITHYCITINYMCLWPQIFLAADQSHLWRTRLLQLHQETRNPICPEIHFGRIQLFKFSKRSGSVETQRPRADDRNYTANLFAD